MLIVKTVHAQIVSTSKDYSVHLISITKIFQILKPLLEQSLDIVSNLKTVFQYFS